MVTTLNLTSWEKKQTGRRGSEQLSDVKSDGGTVGEKPWQRTSFISFQTQFPTISDRNVVNPFKPLKQYEV